MCFHEKGAGFTDNSYACDQRQAFGVPVLPYQLRKTMENEVNCNYRNSRVSRGLKYSKLFYFCACVLTVLVVLSEVCYLFTFQVLSSSQILINILLKCGAIVVSKTFLS